MDNMFNGLIVYDIQLDGNLSGAYRNQKDLGNVNLEIATKKDKNTEIIGTYNCLYFQDGQSNCDVELIIDKGNGLNCFSFEWRNKGGNLVFKGIGYLMNQKQIAVHYWSY